ncbi:hypothetical protein KP509_08G043900 [Ceratopteris richardii]|uniref:ZC3H15/TMA46 family C-terminal domain-containing protein n=1 Tax=Ceratopteris richardii TaxID=49495 RepID=A0A8T2UBQ8_CERRI|nr:hypothetical protein KP509_08G043900 [Ceratopteris richardii]
MGEEGRLDQPKVSLKTKITAEQFNLWKQRKDAEAAAKSAEVARKRAEDIAAGRVQMTGKELYQHEPWVFDDSRFT